MSENEWILKARKVKNTVDKKHNIRFPLKTKLDWRHGSLFRLLSDAVAVKTDVKGMESRIPALCRHACHTIHNAYLSDRN